MDNTIDFISEYSANTGCAALNDKLPYFTISVIVPAK